MSITIFSSQYLDSLREEARDSLRSRKHRNIHKNYDDPCQRFFNALTEDSYIQPHRHSLDPKVETLVAVRGLFGLVTFDDIGNVEGIIRFGTEAQGNSDDLPVGLEISPGIWHTIISLLPDSILLELKAGPFDPGASKEPAPWAPGEQTPEGQAYLHRLKQLITSRQFSEE